MTTPMRVAGVVPVTVGMPVIVLQNSLLRCDRAIIESE